MPVYFQASKLTTPLQSGVNALPYSFSIAPLAIVAGVTATIFKRYRPQNVIAWVFIMIGMGLQSMLDVETSTGKWIGYEIVTGIGFGLLVSSLLGIVKRSAYAHVWYSVKFSATTYPILAPLEVTDNASALSLFIFVRAFMQVRD